MNDSSTSAVVAGSAEDVLRELSTRQFVNPHRLVGDAVADAARRVGICRVATERAIARLELNRSIAIGRLTRTELAQLSRCIFRLWRNIPAATGLQMESQPVGAK